MSLFFLVQVNMVSCVFFQSEGDPLSFCLFIIVAEFLSRGLDHLYCPVP